MSDPLDMFLKSCLKPHFCRSFWESQRFFISFKFIINILEFD
ncbi:hypothetical protein pah_c050o041 [Parachlamydia acanthamoebae str. Hall's coccus]|nr:hypothetical protein pah_c050o041 [Parachlamydia acanthamoebae str. Hall's coccus]